MTAQKSGNRLLIWYADKGQGSSQRSAIRDEVMQCGATI